jgi:hypothetical protein
MTVLRQSLRRMETFLTKVVEEIKTHILCSSTFVFFENRVVCELI